MSSPTARWLPVLASLLLAESRAIADPAPTDRRTAIAALEVEAARRTAEAEAERMQIEEARRRAGAGREQARDDRTVRIVSLVLAGSGLIMAGAGADEAWMARELRDDAARTNAIMLGVSGGALLISGCTLYLMARSAERREARILQALTPTPIPGGVAVSAAGRF